MSVWVWLNVVSHIAAAPVIYEAWKRNQPHTVLILLLSAIAASPFYHLCEGGVWCIFPLKSMTRLDLFHSQAVVTAIIQSMIPYPRFWMELLVLLAVWIVQASILLRASANTRVLQYIVIGISVSPLVMYLIVRFFRWTCGYEEDAYEYEEGEGLREYPNEDVAVTTSFGTLSKAQARYAGRPDRPIFRGRAQISKVKKLPFFYKLYNPRDFLFGLLIGLVGVMLFRLHDIHHTRYDWLHPAWHVFVFLGGYFLLRSAPPRGVDYIVARDQWKKWRQHLTDTRFVHIN